MNKKTAGTKNVGQSSNVSWILDQTLKLGWTRRPRSSEPEKRYSVNNVDRDTGSLLGMPGSDRVPSNLRNLVVEYVVNSADETIQAAPMSCTLEDSAEMDGMSDAGAS